MEQLRSQEALAASHRIALEMEFHRIAAQPEGLAHEGQLHVVQAQLRAGQGGWRVHHHLAAIHQACAVGIALHTPNNREQPGRFGLELGFSALDDVLDVHYTRCA